MNSDYKDGRSNSRILPPGPEYMSALAEHFGLHVNAEYEDFDSLGAAP